MYFNCALHWYFLIYIWFKISFTFRSINFIHYCASNFVRLNFVKIDS